MSKMFPDLFGEARAILNYQSSEVFVILRGFRIRESMTETKGLRGAKCKHCSTTCASRYGRCGKRREWRCWRSSRWSLELGQTPASSRSSKAYFCDRCRTHTQIA